MSNERVEHLEAEVLRQEERADKAEALNAPLLARIADLKADRDARRSRAANLEAALCRCVAALELAGDIIERLTETYTGPGAIPSRVIEAIAKAKEVLGE